MWFSYDDNILLLLKLSSHSEYIRKNLLNKDVQSLHFKALKLFAAESSRCHHRTMNKDEFWHFQNGEVSIVTGFRCGSLPPGQTSSCIFEQKSSHCLNAFLIQYFSNNYDQKQTFLFSGSSLLRRQSIAAFLRYSRVHTIYH